MQKVCKIFFHILCQLEGPLWLGPEKFFEIKSLRRLESAIFKLLSAEILPYPPWLSPERNFQSGGSQMAGKRFFKIGFC